MRIHTPNVLFWYKHSRGGKLLGTLTVLKHDTEVHFHIIYKNNELADFDSQLFYRLNYLAA